MAGIPQNTTYKKTLEELQTLGSGIRNKKGRMLLQKRPSNYLNIQSLFGTPQGAPVNAAQAYRVGAPLVTPGSKFSEVPEGYKFLGADPQGRWQAPTDLTRFANIPGFLGGGSYVQDPSQRGALIKSPRLGDIESEIPAAMARRSRILNGLSSRLFNVDHTIPLWAGGADVESNWQILTNQEHDKKTKVDAVGRTLYLAGEISLKEALANGINWRDKDVAGISLGTAEQYVPPSLELSRVKMEEWKKAPKVTFKDFLKSIPEAGKKIAEATVPEPLREFFKGFVGGLTGGWINPKPGEFSDEPKYYEVANKIARITGSIGGTVASFAGLAGIVGRIANLKYINIAKTWNESSALSRFLPFQKVPILKSTLGKIDYGTLLESMGLFGLHGQLSKQEVNDFEYRSKRFLSDLGTGVFFAGAGGIANTWAKEATISGGMFTLAKLHGASNEDALIDAVAMGIFGGLKATTVTAQMKRLDALNNRTTDSSIAWRTAELKKINQKVELKDWKIIRNQTRDIIQNFSSLENKGALTNEEYLQERNKAILTDAQLNGNLLPEQQRIIEYLRDLSSVASTLKESDPSELTGRPYELQKYIESLQKNPPGTVFTETIPSLDQKVAAMPVGRMFNTGIVIREDIVNKLVERVRKGEIEINPNPVLYRNEAISRQRLTAANQEDIKAGRKPRYNPDDVIVEIGVRARDTKTGSVYIEQIGVPPILEHLGIHDPTIKGPIKYPKGTINHNAVRDGFLPFPETLAAENFGDILRKNNLNWVEAEFTNIGSQETGGARFGIFREQGHRSNKPFAVMEIKPEHWRESFIRNSGILDSKAALAQKAQRAQQAMAETTQNIQPKAAIVQPEPKLPPRWTYKIPRKVQEIKLDDLAEFPQGLNSALGKLIGNEQVKLMARGEVEKAKALNEFKKEFDIDTMADRAIELSKQYPLKIEAAEQYINEIGKKFTDAGLENPFTSREWNQRLKREFHWLSEVAPRHFISVNVDPKTKKITYELSREEVEESERPTLPLDISLNDKFAESEIGTRVKGVTLRPRSEMDFNVNILNKEIGSRVDKIYYDPKKSQIPINLASNGPQKMVFVRQGFRQAGYVPVVTSGNSPNTLLGLKYDPKWVERFDKNESKYVKIPGELKTNEEKFIKVFIVDILKLKKDASQHDLAKRLKQYDTSFPSNQIQGEQITLNTINDPKFSDIPEALKMLRETKFINPISKEMMEATENRGIWDGAAWVSREAIEDMQNARGFVKIGKHLKGSIYYSIEKEDGQQFTIAIKMDISPWGSYKESGSYREYFESLLGKKLGKWDFVLTNDNTKYGLEDMPNKINPNWNKEMGDWAREYREITIPSEAFRFASLETPEPGGSFSLTNLSKLSGKWGLNEPIKKMYEPEINNWRNLVEELNLAVREGRATPEFISSLLERPEFAKYGVDLDKHLYDQYRFAYSQGAGGRLLGEQIERMLNALWQDKIINAGFLDAINLYMKPDLGYIKDGKRVYLAENEKMVSRDTAKDIKIIDGEETLGVRYPAPKLSALTPERTLIAEDYGINDLGRDHIIINPKSTFIKRDGDYDGDQFQTYKIGGEKGLPVELANKIKSEIENTGEILVDISATKIPNKPINRENLDEIIDSTALGNDGINISRATARAIPIAQDNGIKVIVRPGLKEYELARIEFDREPSKIKEGELVFVSKWDTKNKILDAIVSQESVDSITNRGLVERGFDSNYLIARYFTPQNREAARNIIGIDKNGYEYIKDDSIVNAIRKVITGIDAKAAAKLKVEPFPGYQKIFTLANKERKIPSTKYLADTIKEFNDLSRKIQENGGILNPTQEILLLNEFVPFTRVSATTPEMMSLAWRAAEAARGSVRSIWGETIGKMAHTPRVKEFITQAIKANKVNNEARENDYTRKWEPYPSKEERKRLGALEYKKLLALYEKNENVYTQEETDMIQYWLANDYLANKKQSPAKVLLDRNIKNQSGLIQPILELMEGPIAQEWHKTFETYASPQ